MAIINISEKDVKRLKQVDAGWHLAVFNGTEESASKDKMSTNWAFEFEIVHSAVSADNLGRIVYARANSKAPGMTMIPMVAAFNGIKVDEVKPDQIDTDKLTGKKCWIEVEEKVYEGKIQKDVKSFAPENSRPAL